MAGTYLGSQNPQETTRLAAQQPGVGAQVRAALMYCSLPPRARILELGCGTGILTAALAKALPDAQITAIDRDAHLLMEARLRCPQPTIHFERQDAAALPYPARWFDLTICRYVLMHQEAPLVVVGEMHRVVAPGGAAVAIEPDWGARAVYPPNEGESRLLELASAARPFGWPDVRIGRKLFALFRQAGFLPVRILASASCQTADDVRGQEDVEGEKSGNLAQLIEQGRGVLLQQGLISPEDLDAALHALARLPFDRDYLLASMEFTAIGSKGAPPLSGPDEFFAEPASL
ncbi:MAG TPA: methyltransferase domain-containing protein [Ktedonobacterales bacterium]|jgi:SAM-dependent methyltransferase